MGTAFGIRLRLTGRKPCRRAAVLLNSAGSLAARAHKRGCRARSRGMENRRKNGRKRTRERAEIPIL